MKIVVNMDKRPYEKKIYVLRLLVLVSVCVGLKTIWCCRVDIMVLDSTSPNCVTVVVIVNRAADYQRISGRPEKCLAIITS